MKYYLLTLGCQMNKSDSERLARVLADLGYQKTPEEQRADLLIINACSVRQTAIDRVYGRLERWGNLKKKKPGVRTILTGCVLEADKKRLKGKFNLIFDIKELGKLPQMLGLKNDFCADYFKIKPQLESIISAYIPIMTGCDNFCGYCAVPYVRGQEISRPAEEILKEISELIQRGYQNFTLLGQNVNSYQAGLVDFVALLEKICALEGNFYVKFYSNHPKDFKDELIALMAREEKIVKYVHLPLQSGSDEILRKMNRKYTQKEYLDLVHKICVQVPGVVLTTDVIVGFPGETAEQFQNSVKVFKKANYDMAFIAKFSPRPQTAAAKLKDDVSAYEKKRREKILTEILEESAQEKNKKLIGQVIKAVARDKKSNNLWQAEALTLKPIQFRGFGSFEDTIVELKVTRAAPWSLRGELL